MSRAAALGTRYAAARRPLADDRPSWAADGREWPEGEWSRFVEAGGLLWHVQQYGRGEDVLLLHGVAAATHSWRGLGPRLAERFRVTTVDLPGHGFTTPPTSEDGYTPGGMAAALAPLLERLEVRPALVVGHSAGSALGAALVLDGHAAPRRLIAVNGALSSRHAFSGAVFPMLARLASQPALAALFAARADRARVERVIASTGSTLDAEGVELYRRLFARRAHVSAAFAMMANWNRGAALARLHRLPCPLTLIVAEDDRAVPPADADAVAGRLRGAEVRRLPHGGHLVHEQHPEAVAEQILAAADRETAA